MKILLIHTSYNFRGGEDNAFENEVSMLRSHNITVDTLIFRNNPHSIVKILFSHFNPLSYFKTRQKIKKSRPDIVHIHNWHFSASPSIIWAAKKSRVPVVQTLHNYRMICPSGFFFFNGKIFLDSLQGGFPWSAVKKKVYRNSLVLTFWVATVIRLHRFLGTWKKVDRFIVLTEFSKNIFLQSDLEIANKKIIVKPNFTKAVQHSPIVKNSTFIYIGRLSEEKGIDLVFQAFQIKKFNLLIIGDGPLKEEVKSFADANSEIEYIGLQERKTINDKLQSCTALIFATKCYEGMPLTILESFANSTPVIAPSLGSIPEIVTDKINGLLFKTDDAADLSDKITEWDQMPLKEKASFAENCLYTYHQKFTVNANYHQLLFIYKELL